MVFWYLPRGYSSSLPSSLVGFLSTLSPNALGIFHNNDHHHQKEFMNKDRKKKRCPSVDWLIGGAQ